MSDRELLAVMAAILYRPAPMQDTLGPEAAVRDARNLLSEVDRRAAEEPAQLRPDDPVFRYPYGIIP